MPDSRKAVAADMEAVLALRKQLNASVKPDEIAFRSTFPKLLNESQHCILVLEDDGNVLAYASGYKHLTLYAGGFVAYLDEIVVASKARGKRLGTVLLTAFENWAHAEGCVLVGLATGGARGFYEKLSYETRAGYYKKKLT